ncbi:MAG: hypothetical protein ABL932_11690 [Terricaulis sp.]
MMMRTMLVAASLMLVPSLAHAQSADPLARAREGWIECHDANTVSHTCSAFSAYRFLDSGEVMNDAIMHLNVEPLVIVYSTSTVYARGDLVCEQINRAAIDSARVTVDGQPAPREFDRQIKDAVWNVYIGVSELCTRTTTNGDVGSVTVFFDGVERPDLAVRFHWIRPDAGYTLAPAPETSHT